MRIVDLHHPPIRVAHVRTHAADLSVDEHLLLAPNIGTAVSGYTAELQHLFPRTALGLSSVHGVGYFHSDRRTASRFFGVESVEEVTGTQHFGVYEYLHVT